MSEATVEIGDKWAILISDAFVEWALSNDAKDGDFKLTPLLKEAFYESGEAQQEDIGRILKTNASFNMRLPDAEKWIEKRAADRIKYINDAKKQTIRDIVLRGFQEGLTSQEQSKLIREHIGLLPAHSKAVDNYRKNLLSSGMDSSSADKLADKYRKKLLKYRADTIALTEGHTAANEGYRFANREAASRGIFPPGKYERYWMVTRQRNTCEKCGKMSGIRADLPDGNFEGDGQGPPLHPRCRCTEGIRKKGSPTNAWERPIEKSAPKASRSKVQETPKELTITGSQPKKGEPIPKKSNPIAKEVVTHIDATTIKDAHKFAESMGVKLVGGKSDTVEINNQVNKWLVDRTNAGLPVPKKIVIDENKFTNKRVIANCDHYNSAININPVSAHWSDAVAKGSKNVVGGWHESANVLDHEMGHYLHQQVDPKKYEKMLENYRKPEGNVPDRYKSGISRYGQTTQLELVAEMYSGLVAGKSYPRPIMDYYESLGGPTV
jgi:hypothetical protein